MITEFVIKSNINNFKIVGFKDVSWSIDTSLYKEFILST